MPEWLSEFIEKWHAQSRSTQYMVITIALVAALLVVIPWRASAEEGNPLGIQVDSHPLSGSDSYSAESLMDVGSTSGVKLSSTDKESSAEVTVESSVVATKDSEYSEDLTTLVDEYEAFSSELAWSRSNDPNYAKPTASSTSNASSNSSQSSSSSSSTGDESSSTVEASGGTYTVQSGDNAYRIATNNGLALDEFLSMNGKTEPSVTPGEEVRIQ